MKSLIYVIDEKSLITMILGPTFSLSCKLRI